jgi:hypothetical protein
VLQWCARDLAETLHGPTEKMSFASCSCGEAFDVEKVALDSAMQVGRLDVMSNVVSASSLLVHRNEDAENSFSIEPNDVDILRAAALREALPDDQ